MDWKKKFFFMIDEWDWIVTGEKKMSTGKEMLV